MVPSVVREGSDQRGPEKVLRRSWKRSATDFAFCFSLQTFFFSRSSVIFSFQLELAALPLGPQAQCPSVEDVLGALASSLGTHRAWKARPCGPELMTRPAVGAVQ